MKTKLLLLLLFSFSFVKAQINVLEGFESATTPVGWIYDIYQRSTNASSSGTASLRANFGTTAAASITTPNYTSNGEQINFSFRARTLTPAVSHLNYVKYAINNGSWIDIGNFPANNSNPWQLLNYSIPAGVVPSGSTVKFQIVTFRTAASGVIDVYFDTVEILQGLPIPSTVAEYTFDNTYDNVNGNTPFSSNSGASFVTDRHGNQTGALNLSFTVSQATIPFLPTANAARSVSVWIKPVNIGGQNIAFSYGANSTNNSYGFSYDANTIANFGFSNDLQSPFVLNAGNWKHVVCTYSTTGVATIYIDGVAIISESKPAWNTINSVFRLGFLPSANLSDISFDDLKIFNYTLSTTEITNLFTNNTLSSQNFNQNNLQVSLYPNPTSDILNIEMANEVKSIEIYNIQGQKVLESSQKQINVSELSAGMYMVKIQDTENAVATKKVIIN